MTDQNKDMKLDLVVSRYFEQLNRSLVAPGKFQLPRIEPIELGRALDGSFARLDLIGDIINLIKNLCSKLPHWIADESNGVRFDPELLKLISERGFASAFNVTKNKDDAAKLYNRMLIDVTLFQDAYDAILGAEEVSPFWASRLYSPDVRLIDLVEEVEIGISEFPSNTQPIECAIDIDDSTLIATWTHMQLYRGRYTEFVLHSMDDSIIAIQGKAYPPGDDACSESSNWLKQWKESFKKCPRRGKTRIDNDGVLVCRVEDRPTGEELMASILTVALMEGVQ